MARLRTALVIAALTIPAAALAAGASQDAPAAAPAYQLEQPTHDLAQDCTNRMTRALDAQVTAIVRCTADDRGRPRRCELVEPTSDAQRQRRVLVCLAEAHRLVADDLSALEGEVVEIGVSIG
jgi:hypothetical protein